MHIEKYYIYVRDLQLRNWLFNGKESGYDYDGLCKDGNTFILDIDR